MELRRLRRLSDLLAEWYEVAAEDERSKISEVRFSVDEEISVRENR